MKVKDRYKEAEIRADQILAALVLKPWTLAALILTHAAAVALGAFLF